MEADFPFVARPKRKYDDDDGVLDLLNNVSLSPHKKLRQDAGLATIFEDCPNVLSSGGLHETMAISPPPEIDLPEEVPKICPSNERAIVLYKPVYTPAFIDASRAGSLSLPTELTGRIFSTGMLDSSNILTVPNTRDWFGAAIGNSSVRSTDCETSEERMMSEATPDNRLAVIPWAGVNMASNNHMATSQAATFSREVEEMGIEGALVSEAMEEDNELEVNDNFLCNDSLGKFGTEPWQQYGVPQPQYNPVMWSH